MVIGAWAFPAHGYSRSTYDIDVFFNSTKENVRCLAKTLKDGGLEDLTTEDILKKKLFRQYVLDTDIHPLVAETEYKNVWRTKKEVEIEGVKVFVPSLEDLVRMKKAAGRNKDLADLEYLEEIKRNKSKK